MRHDDTCMLPQRIGKHIASFADGRGERMATTLRAWTIAKTYQISINDAYSLLKRQEIMELQGYQQRVLIDHYLLAIQYVRLTKQGNNG